MQLSTRIDQEACVILLDGELDASSSILIDKALEAVMHREQKFILVNFARLTYISAAGIGAFIYHIKQMADENKIFVFYNMNISVRNIFLVTGLDEVISIVDNEEEAQLWCRQKACN
jgi:anti-sigma B factor antagonist